MSLKRDKRYLLVVTVLNGRNFPQRPTESLRIDVRFDGQLLSSLPAPLVEDPVFDTDMAFRLSAKQLKDHKVQRTPIKIEVFKVNRKTKLAEKIGYLTLDLRSYAVEVGKPRFIWLALLGAQALRRKPELHIGVSVDDDPDVDNDTLTQNEFTRSARNKNYWKQNQPVLISDPDGSTYYQLGPSKDSTGLFLITVTIGYASNLDQCVDESQLRPNSPRGLFFHYELVDNHLTTKPFSDFNATDFSPERVSLRIRSYPELLREFFLNQNILKINLCQGPAHIIAHAELPYRDIFPADLQDILETILIEKELLLIPISGDRSASSEEPREIIPVVGVAFEVSVIRRIDPSKFSRTLTIETAKPFVAEIEDRSRPVSAKTPRTEESKSISQRSRSLHALNSYENEDEKREKEITALMRRTVGQPEVSSNERRNDDRPEFNLSKRRTVTQLESNSNGRNAGQPEVSSRGQFPSDTSALPKRPKSDEQVEEDQYSWQHRNGRADVPQARLHSAATQVSPVGNAARKDEGVAIHPDMRPAATQTFVGFETQGIPSDLVLPEGIRRYVCTIYLYKIRMVSVNYRYTMPIYLRYQYPFFGSAAPIMTRPAVEVQPKQETILDGNALTQFTFGCSESQLLRAFRAVPVCIEVWRSGSGMVQDQFIGQAKLRLDLLHRAEPSTLYENDKPYSRRLFDVTLEVIDLQSDKYPKLAELTVCTTLDDYGAVHRQIVDSTAPSLEDMYDPKREVEKKSAGPTLNVEQMEKDAVFELERWKEREEKKFRAQLKKQEEEAMRNLSEEWERRTKQQKSFMDENIQKYRDLEEELRKLIGENTQKESVLKERERRVSEAEQFLKSEKIKLTRDIEEVQRNVIQEYSKRLELEQSSQNLLKAEVKQCTCTIDDLKKRLAEREDEITRLKDTERQKPFQQREMQSEIDRITLDKNDLERRNAALTESKEHYKQQWDKALKDIAKMRDRVDIEHEKRLHDKEREINLLLAQLERTKQRMEINNRAAVIKDRRDHQNNREEQPPKQRLAMRFSGGGDGIEEEDSDNSTDNDEHAASTVNAIGLSGYNSGTDSDVEEENSPRTRLLKAMEERNVLLKTGIYKPRDTVIVDLDKKISKLETIVRGRL